jgi:hypothetical protein
MEKLLNNIGIIIAKLPKLASVCCKLAALLCVFHAFAHGAWHCLFTALLYLVLSLVINKMD